MLSPERALAPEAVAYLGAIPAEGHSGIYEMARSRLLLAAAHPEPETPRAFLCLGTAHEDVGLRELAEAYPP